MICPKCGKSLPADAKKCRYCGQDQGLPYTEEQSGGPDMKSEKKEESAAGYIGWSSLYFQPDVQKYVSKKKRVALRRALYIVVLPFIIFFALGLVFPQLNTTVFMWIGIGLSLLMIPFVVRRYIQLATPVWEGEVISKSEEKRAYRQSKKEKDSNEQAITYIEYKVNIKKDDGKLFKLSDKNKSVYYDFFNVGDRVRCFPIFETYEKYDKTKGSFIFCLVCGQKNPIENVQCEACKAMLFKSE